MERNIIIHAPFGEDIKFRAFWGEEALSSLFEFSVEMRDEKCETINVIQLFTNFNELTVFSKLF